MNQHLEKKVAQAIRLIRSVVGDDVVEVAYSGGKDSDVILELTRMAGVKYRAIYKNTTIDQPGTIRHVIERGAEIHPPVIRFFDLVRKKGMPTRRTRFCCEKMKEYKVLDKAIIGIRREESKARSDRYPEPVQCRIYGAKTRRVTQILPILEWTMQDEAEFIAERHIQCHPTYYDESGKFHPERRLGCLACPLRGDRGLSDYQKYPKFFLATVKAVAEWWYSKDYRKTHDKFKTVYGVIACNLFYRSFEAWQKDYNDGRDFKFMLETKIGVTLPPLEQLEKEVKAKILSKQMQEIC